MGEHSVMDGTPTVRLCDELLDMLADPSFDHGSEASSNPLYPAPLDWEMTPEITDAIAKADKAAAELIESQSLSFHLTKYGKAAIKKFGVSPDGWAQMIIQLAYARLLASLSTADKFLPSLRNGATYEAASTRKYLKGRTEAIRIVSTESDKWVMAMDDRSVGRDERRKLFAEAIKRHGKDARACGNGEGIDRHLFGRAIPRLLESFERLIFNIFQD
jgi:carnitine O-acetyltransferase